MGSDCSATQKSGIYYGSVVMDTLQRWQWTFCCLPSHHQRTDCYLITRQLCRSPYEVYLSNHKCTLAGVAANWDGAGIHGRLGSSTPTCSKTPLPTLSITALLRLTSFSLISSRNWWSVPATCICWINSSAVKMARRTSRSACRAGMYLTETNSAVYL